MIGLPFGLLASSPPETISYQGITSFTGSDPINVLSIATMRVQGVGRIDRGGNQSMSSVASWVQDAGPSFDPVDYDFRLDTVAGTLSLPGSDLADIWIPGVAGLIAEWGEQEASSSIEFFAGIFRVRPSGGGADMITQSISITADNTP